MGLVLRFAGISTDVVHSTVEPFSRITHRGVGVSRQMESVRIGDLADDGFLDEQLVNWERGTLSSSETLAFFQELADSGLAWRSTGSVRRTAAMLLRDGRIQRPLSSSGKQFELGPRGNVIQIASSEMVSP